MACGQQVDAGPGCWEPRWGQRFFIVPESARRPASHGQRQLCAQAGPGQEGGELGFNREEARGAWSEQTWVVPLSLQRLVLPPLAGL